MREALALTDEILHFEPDNQLIKEYKRSLSEYIAQGSKLLSTRLYLLQWRYLNLTLWLWS
jgi:hypothetical protein